MYVCFACRLTDLPPPTPPPPLDLTPLYDVLCGLLLVGFVDRWLSPVTKRTDMAVGSGPAAVARRREAAPYRSD